MTRRFARETQEKIRETIVQGDFAKYPIPKQFDTMLLNKNNVNTFRKLQEVAKLDLNETLFKGRMTLLQIACDEGWTSIVEDLLSRSEISVNFSVNAPTPLMFAVRRGHLDVIENLLRHPDIQLDATDMDGMTAPFYICNFLNASHGYQHLKYSDPEDPVIIIYDSVQQTEMEAKAKGNALAALRLLVKAGCDLDVVDNKGQNVLNRAIECACHVKNFNEVSNELVEYGIRPAAVYPYYSPYPVYASLDYMEKLRRPAPLKTQARKIVRKYIRRCSSNQMTFPERISKLEGGNLPTVLVEYLHGENK